MYDGGAHPNSDPSPDSANTSSCHCDRAGDVETAQESAACGAGDDSGFTSDMIEQFPPEIASLLIIAGIAGVLLPGPVGAPLLIAGGVILWPKTFRPIERWFSRRFPCMHREGVLQLKEFIHDLQKRFPDSN